MRPKPRGTFSLLIAVFIFGFSALGAQIVFLRELLVLFYGNELSLGVILGCWLFWTGMGSLVLGRFADRFQNPVLTLAFFQCLLALVLIITLPAIRSIKLFLEVSPGQILGYLSMFQGSFFSLSLCCLLNGFLFSLAGKACADIYRRREAVSRGVGVVYILESLGSVIGGLITSFFLIRFFSSLGLLFLLASINLAAAGGIIFSFPSPPRRRQLRWAWLAAASFLLIFILAGGVASLDKISRGWEWEGFDLKKTRSSVYGNLAVTGRDHQFSLFENGLLLFTRPDRYSSEQAVHFGMLEHPSPRRVLLIGGGVGGSLEEILKYPGLEKVTYLELDPAVVGLAEEFIPPEQRDFLTDPRVEIIYTDGRRYLQRTHRRFDVIIIDLPDPFTAQINRFYTRQFYRLARDRLRSGGIICFGVTSSSNYISGELQNFIGCVYQTLREAFPEVTVIPGGSNFFIASEQSGYLSDDYRVLENRIRERKIDLKYIRGYYLSDRMSRERIDYLRDKLRATAGVRINTDFHPVCYYYDLVFWSSYFAGESGSWFGGFLQRATILRWWWFLAPVAAAVLLFPILRRRRRRSRGAWVLWPVLTSGFSEIVFQVVILLAFQILYGYVYYKLGIILSLFMAGLVAGGGTATGLMSRLRKKEKIFFLVQILICVYPLLLPPAFRFFAGSQSPLRNWLGENLIFPLLPLIAGFAGGFQFPLAVEIYLRRRKRSGLVSGLVYGFDLLGACLGALLISALILPLLGISATCYTVALINLTSLVVIRAYSRRS